MVNINVKRLLFYSIVQGPSLSDTYKTTKLFDHIKGRVHIS